MKTVKTYDAYLADYGEADMQECTNGSYVRYYDYMQLYKKYIRARATVKKNKIKATLKSA
jgi:hypothetical protein